MSPHCNAYLPADLESDSLLYAAIIYDCHMGRAVTLVLHSAEVFLWFLCFVTILFWKTNLFPVTVGIISALYTVQSTQMPRFKWFKICYMQLIESEQNLKKKTKKQTGMFLNCVLSACPLLQRNVHFLVKTL